jgi:cell division protein FtsB
MSLESRIAASLILLVLVAWVPRWCEQRPVHAELEQRRAEIASLEQRITEQTALNRSRLRQVESLSSDPRTVEGRARDEFGYVHPEDLVFLFENGETAAQ